jgi:TetR/AcrR family transcriptional regulator, transcriptional repressor of bet genes
VDEPTQKLATAAYANLTGFVVHWLTEAVNRHETAEGVDVARAARHLISVIEGLRWPLLFGVFTEHEALDVLDAQLDQIFGSSATPGPSRGP